GLTELRQLTDELFATEGWHVKHQLDGIHRTWKVLSANWQLVGKTLGRFKQDSEYALKVWGGARANPEWDTFLDLVDLALHNYIASVVALADHTSKVADRVLQGESHSLYRGEYNRRFREDPRSSFVRGLRNYLLHRALPITSGSFHFEKDGPFSHAIMLSVEALADDDGWNPKALDFMDEAGEGLDIYETLLAHYNDTRSFQKRFEALVFEANKEVIAETNEIADRRNALIPPVRKELEATTHDGVVVPHI
ncbi:MAG: hypothetical protein WBM90_00510, partial [Acidimicrobiia bacterium]